MNVTTVSASVKLSKQLPGQECWKTMELGAVAGLDAGQDWKVAQSQLYIHLTQQLRTLWGEAKVAGMPPTQGAAPPAAAAPAPEQRQDQAPAGEESGPTCPVHDQARPSRHGGLYCPGTTDEGVYCKWTWRPEKAKTTGRK
jgi:hypothetical protein